MGLLGDTAVDLVFTDPPFNVPINGHVRSGLSQFEEFAEASVTVTESPDLTQAPWNVAAPGNIDLLFERIVSLK